MKTFPKGIRGAKPKRGRWWRFVFIPGVQFMGNEISVGFWRSTHDSVWHPRMKGWALVIDRSAKLFRKHPWSSRKFRFLNKL